MGAVQKAWDLIKDVRTPEAETLKALLGYGIRDYEPNELAETVATTYILAKALDTNGSKDLNAELKQALADHKSKFS